MYEFFRNERYSRPSLNKLDRKLEEYLDIDKGYFIEAGANDGYNQSKKRRKNSIVMNYALVSNNYQKATVSMQYANLMSYVKQKNYVSEQLMNDLDNALKIQDIATSFEVEVPARTLTSILDEINPPKIIDLLSLDVEGYESEVLKGLDFNKYKPRYICVEVRDKQAIISLLENNYEQISILSDLNGLSDILFRAK